MNSFLFYGAVNLLAKLLPRRVCYAAARPVAEWGYRHNHEARKALEENLRVVIGSRGEAVSETEIEQLVHRNFENFVKYVVDFFRVGRLSEKALSKLIKVENVEYLHQCRGLKRGVIGATAHIGNWELGASVMAANGLRFNAVVRTQASPIVDALFASQRRRRGVLALSMDDAAASVSACLKRNDFVALLADLDFSHGRRTTTFFGRPACLPRGPAVLARRSGAPILPAFVLRQPDDTFCFRAYPPIVPDVSQTVGEIQECLVAVLEAVIAGHPDQWFVYKPMW